MRLFWLLGYLRLMGSTVVCSKINWRKERSFDRFPQTVFGELLWRGELVYPRKLLSAAKLIGPEMFTRQLFSGRFLWLDKLDYLSTDTIHGDFWSAQIFWMKSRFRKKCFNLRDSDQSKNKLDPLQAQALKDLGAAFAWRFGCRFWERGTADGGCENARSPIGMSRRVCTMFCSLHPDICIFEYIGEEAPTLHWRVTTFLSVNCICELKR